MFIAIKSKCNCTKYIIHSSYMCYGNGTTGGIIKVNPKEKQIHNLMDGQMGGWARKIDKTL